MSSQKYAKILKYQFGAPEGAIVEVVYKRPDGGIGYTYGSDSYVASPDYWEPVEHEAEPEMVDHPAHYGGGDNPYEVIKVIEAWNLDFPCGNAVKYIARAPHKGKELQDLKKAVWYLTRRIGQLEDINDES